MAERMSGRQACMPSQHVEQQAACTHTHQIGDHPGVRQHSSGQYQQGMDIVQQHNAGGHHMQSHWRGGESRAPARRLSQSQASVLEGAAPRHQAVQMLSSEGMQGEEDAARQQGCEQSGREDKTVRRSQQQPVVLLKQQPSEMYYLPQPSDDLSSGPAQQVSDAKLLPPTSYQKPGETIAAVCRLSAADI